MKTQLTNNSDLMQMLVHASVGVKKLTIRPRKKISVRFLDLGEFTETPITVQVFRSGDLTHCSHANHTKRSFIEEDFKFDPIYGNVSPVDREIEVFVCNKCEAWSYDLEEWL